MVRGGNLWLSILLEEEEENGNSHYFGKQLLLPKAKLS